MIDPAIHEVLNDFCKPEMNLVLEAVPKVTHSSLSIDSLSIDRTADSWMSLVDVR